LGKGLQKCAIFAALDLNGGLAINLIPKEILKSLPILQQIFCIKGVFEAVKSCAGSESSSARMKVNNLPNAVLRENANNLQTVINGYNAERNWMTECFGVLIDRDSWPILYTLLVNPFFDKQMSIPASIQIDIITLMAGYDISPSELSAFFTRWNTSLEAKANNALAPNAAYPNIINRAVVI
jgi:large repetitive protein